MTDKIVISHYRPGSMLGNLIVILRQTGRQTQSRYYTDPSDRDIRRLTQCAERLTDGPDSQVREYRYSTHYITHSQETDR
jgi:hypothetical protein